MRRAVALLHGRGGFLGFDPVGVDLNFAMACCSHWNRNLRIYDHAKATLDRRSYITSNISDLAVPVFAHTDDQLRWCVRTVEKVGCTLFIKCRLKHNMVMES